MANSSYPQRKISAQALITQAVLMMGVWIVMSGKFDLFHLSAGVISLLLVLWFNARIYRLQLTPDDHVETHRIRLLAFVRYCFWLLWEIVVSSVQVARIVLHPKLPIDPHLLRFRTRLPNLAAKVILANSITLTPGTVTIEIKNGEFFVHALSEVSSSNLVDGSMPVEVAKIFGSAEEHVLYDLRISKSAKEV